MTTAILENGICISAGDITVYEYNNATGEYAGTSTEFIPVGVSIPALSTITPPLSPQEKQCCVWIDGAWEYIADHRGEVVYNTENRSAVEITALGDYPSDTTVTAPATDYDVWNNGGWVTDTKAQQAAIVAAANKIKSSLISEATTEISPLEDAQSGGYLDESDIPILQAWQKYRYLLTKVNTSTAPNVSWPQKPAE